MILDPVPCLGLSDHEYAILHGNPEKDPLRRGGNTPTGEYSVTPVRFSPPVDESKEHSYGPYGLLELTPLSGQCLTAQEVNGRAGIAIHSGVLNPAYTQTHGLRATHGCVRVSNENLLDIFTEIGALLTTHGTEKVTCSVTEIK